MLTTECVFYGERRLDVGERVTRSNLEALSPSTCEASAGIPFGGRTRRRRPSQPYSPRLPGFDLPTLRNTLHSRKKRWRFPLPSPSPSIWSRRLAFPRSRVSCVSPRDVSWTLFPHFFQRRNMSPKTRLAEKRPRDTAAGRRD